MSVTNIINNEELTLVQGVGGLFLCEESWATQNRRNARRREVSEKEIIATKNNSNSTKCSRTELWDLPQLSNV